MLDAYDKKLEEQKPDMKEEYVFDVKEILADKEKGILFGDLLKNNQRNDLAEKIAKGSLDQNDMVELSGYRKNLTEKYNQVKTIESSIKKEDVLSYVKNSPELQKIVSMVGIDSYTEIIKKKLAYLSVNDESRFNRLRDAVTGKFEFQEGDFKELDSEITKELKRYNIKESSFSTAAAIQDPDERAKALRKVAKEGFGFFGSVRNIFTFGGYSKSIANEMDDIKLNDLDPAINRLNSHREEIGGFLAGLVGNDSMSEAVSKEMIGERYNTVNGEAFSASKNSIPKREILQGELWDEYKKKHPLTGAATINDAYKENFLQEQEAIIKSQQNSKKGFWASLIESLFTSDLTNNRDAIKQELN